MTLFTVGFGARIPSGGLHPLPAAKTLADLQAEIDLARKVYNMPESAGICRAGPGSIYLFELTWVAEDDAPPRDDPKPDLPTRDALVEVRRRLTNVDWSSGPEDRIRVPLRHIDAAIGGATKPDRHLWMRDVGDVTAIIPQAPADTVASIANLIGEARAAERQRVLDEVAGA